MEIKELIRKTEEFLSYLKQLNEDKLVEMGSFETRLPFPKFRQECLRRYQLKKENKDFKHKNTGLYFVTKNIEIYDKCIEHVLREHKDIQEKEWEDFLKTFSPIKDKREKAKYNGKFGKRYVYKCYNDQSTYGYVLDIFNTARSKLVTMFKDNPNSVDNWFDNVVKGNIKIEED